MFLIFFDVNFIEQYKCTMTNTNTNNYKTWYKFNIIYKKRVKSIFSITFSSHSSSPISAWGYKAWQFSLFMSCIELCRLYDTQLNSTIFLYLIIIVYNCWHLRIIIMTKLKKKNKLFVQCCCSVILQMSCGYFVIGFLTHWPYSPSPITYTEKHPINAESWYAFSLYSPIIGRD